MALLLATVVASVPACTSVSGTSRSQLNAYSIEQEIRLGEEAYAERVDSPIFD